MSKIKSPVEKKRVAYAQDHFSEGEYPHGFRVGWPRKEAAASREFRRKVAQKLGNAIQTDVETASEIDVSDIRRRPVKKWGAITLRERVAHKLARRQRSHGAKRRRRIRLRDLTT
jgi:hypothetical protein